MRIAIIGTGLAGLTAAYLLNNKYDLLVFEKNNYVGGNNLMCNPEAKDLTTGFAIFNKKTQPLFAKLLNNLNVNYQQTTIGFSVKNTAKNFEFLSSNISSFSYKMLHPRFIKMRIEINKFKRVILQYAVKSLDYEEKFSDFLDKYNFSNLIRESYIYPMLSFIWPCSPNDLAGFSAKFVCEYLVKYEVLNKPNSNWCQVIGGAIKFIDQLAQSYPSKILLNTQIISVSKLGEKYVVIDNSGGKHVFDKVVFACNARQAGKILANNYPQLNELVNNINHQTVKAILHTDTCVMPKQRNLWSNLNCMLHSGVYGTNISYTYNLNKLQNIVAPKLYLLTLNPWAQPNKDKIIGSFNYNIPMYNPTTLKMRTALLELSGMDNLYFIGAYLGYGNNEDAVTTAYNLVEKIDSSLVKALA